MSFIMSHYMTREPFGMSRSFHILIFSQVGKACDEFNRSWFQGNHVGFLRAGGSHGVLDDVGKDTGNMDSAVNQTFSMASESYESQDSQPQLFFSIYSSVLSF